MIFTADEIIKKIVPIAIKHGVDSLGIFGSYARNEANDDSDLDFIMDDGNVSSLSKYMALVNDLEDEFKCHIDLISYRSHNKVFLDKIKNDVVIIYER